MANSPEPLLNLQTRLRRCPEGREREWGSWGGGSGPPPHEGLESAVSSPSGVWGRAPENLVQLETSKFATEMPFNVQIKSNCQVGAGDSKF